MGLSAHKAYNSAWCCTSIKYPVRPLMYCLMNLFLEGYDQQSRKRWKLIDTDALCSIFFPLNI